MMKRLFVATVLVSIVAALPALGQQFPPIGDDNTSSLGSFKIQVTNQFAPLFAGCPGFNNPILSSPTLYDPATRIGRSDALLDGGAADTAGVPVGTAGTVVSEGMLIPPPGYPCAGAPAGCMSGANTREIHTEVRSLKMVNLGGPLPVVRAGVWYDSSTVQNPPSKVSPGEVESQSGPGGAAVNDLPGSSFFDIFVRVDMPACGKFPGATLYNALPLIVKNPNLTALPPRVVYLHDTSSVVPILFLNANPPLWNKDDVLGYFVLAGHGVGFTNSQSDVNEFNTFMSQQSFTCVTTSGTTAGSTETQAAPHNNAAVISTGPGPSPSPTPAPNPCSNTKTVN
jgi:hypothetical protein